MLYDFRMDYRIIDMDSYPRKKHFEHFSSLAFPYLGLTDDIDITELRKGTEREGTPALPYATLYSWKGDRKDS